MNYCSIQEAWGNNDYISNQFKSNNNSHQKKTIESFSNVKNNHNTKKMSCSDFFNHVQTCNSCKLKMKNQFKSKILEQFTDTIETNREVIVLILVGLCIVLFFNLISSVSK
jgi:hypothetical protein